MKGLVAVKPKGFMSSFHYHLFRPIIVLLMYSIRYSLSVGARANVLVFQKTLFSLFLVIKSHPKVMSKIIFGIKLRLHEGRRLPAIIWLCL